MKVNNKKLKKEAVKKKSFNAWALKLGEDWVSSLLEEGEITYNVFATRKEARDYKTAMFDKFSKSVEIARDISKEEFRITKVRIEEI